MERCGCNFLVLAVALILLVLNPHEVKCENSESKILFISFDGFRWDYLRKANTPNFDEFVADGVFAENGIRSAYATKTFPNHWSLVTGMWEQSHGVVANTIYDPVYNEIFNMLSSTENDTKWWNSSEPLWNTAEKQGVRAGAYFWPGVNVKLQNMHPTFYTPTYNQSIPFSNRVETVISWLTDESTPLQLVNLYYHEPDYSGHRYGPDSTEVAEVIAELDGFLGRMIDRLKDVGLYQTMNIIITSDHGMATVTANRMIDIINLVNETVYNSFTAINPNALTFTHILPDEGKLEFVYNSLKNVHPNMTVYLKKDIPERWNYKNNRRVPPIMLVADDGYEIFMNTTELLVGDHGYDNDLQDMHPIFIARGPAFKSGLKFGKIFDNVDIQPMVCKILDIKCPKSDGSLREVMFLLKDGGGGGDDPTGGLTTAQITIIIVMGSVVGFVVFTMTLILGRRYRTNKQSSTDLMRGDYEQIVSPLLSEQPSIVI